MITKQQYRKLMSEYQATGNVTNSAMKAGMSRRIARKYLQPGQPPQELQVKHTWRTREDPLVEIWPQSVTPLSINHHPRNATSPELFCRRSRRS